MKLNKDLKWELFGFILIISVFSVDIVSSQNVPTPVQCGSIVDNEFTPTILENNYVFDLAPGDQFSVEIVPLGSNVEIIAEIFDPFGDSLNRPAGSQPGTPPVVRKVGASGSYSIVVKQYIGGGLYSLRIGCILNDGTVIDPGDVPPTIISVQNTGIPAAPTFSGNGFPGLAPVDFSSVAKIPMIANVPMTGGVAPDGSTILGYTVDAAANDTLALGFTRLSGNLNLGLVVLSADNQVVFQASLVTSSELTTKFTVPTAGTYTIGVFRIDLLPPAAPEATAFQLTAILNP